MARGVDLSAVFKSISSGEIRPLCAVTGEDPGLREEVVSRIRRAVFGEEPAADGQVIFGPPDPARPSSAPRLAEVMDEVRTASLFATRKLVLVRGADALLAGSGAGEEKKKSAAAAAAALLKYMKSPTPGTVLVLEAEKLDGRTALGKALAKAGALLALPRLYFTRFGESEPSMDAPAGAYLAQLARDRGLKLSGDAGRRLLELADGEVGGLGAELDKLAGYLGKAKRAVSVEDVEALAIASTGNARSLAQDALRGHTAEALRAAEKVFERGLEIFGRIIWDDAAIALAVVNALGRELRTVERAVLNGGRCPPTRSGKSLPPQVARPIEEAARRLRGAVLERAYRLVLEADLALKSNSGRRPQAILEELVVALGGSAVPSGRTL